MFSITFNTEDYIEVNHYARLGNGSFSTNSDVFSTTTEEEEEDDRVNVIASDEEE